MLEQLSIITYGLGNTAIANEIFIIDKLGGVIEQISVYFKNRIPGHPGPFRDKGTKSGSVPDVPGRLATMGLSHYTSAGLATLQGVCQKAVKGKKQMSINHFSVQSTCFKIAKCLWY